MQTKSVGFLALLFLFSLGFLGQDSLRAQEDPKGSSPPLTVEINKYTDLATQTSLEINEQLALIDDIPNNVMQAYSTGVQHLEGLSESMSSSDLVTARKQFHKSMRSFQKVANFLLESQSGESDIPEDKLGALVEKQYKRIQKRVAKLQKLNDKHDLGADFGKVDAGISRAERAFSRNDIERLRACLSEMKTSILEVEDYISEQLSLLEDN